MFDDGRERYAKMRENATRGIISQVGLCFFTFNRQTCAYTAHPYNFYVFPAGFGSMDDTFLCQTSGIKFLARHKFDFNKVCTSLTHWPTPAGRLRASLEN